MRLLEKRLVELSDGRSVASSDHSKKSSRYNDDQVEELERKMSQLQSEMHKVTKKEILINTGFTGSICQA